MKLVIEIPEEEYSEILKMRPSYPDEVFCWIKAIQNGTPIPEHHGRLIDADELYGNFIDGTEGYDCNTWNRIEIGDIIEDAPTIIEGSDNNDD